MIRDLINEYELKVLCFSVPSEDNRANVLSRVKKICLSREEHKHGICALTSTEDLLFAKQVSEQHHFGVERTWYLVKQTNKNITKI